MPAPRIQVALAAVVALTAACGGADPDAAGADAGGSASGGGAVAAESPVCLQADRYIADGPVPVSPPAGGDAVEIEALRWARHDGCERFVIDLAGEGGGPAMTPGVVTADVLRDLGVVRIELREVERVAGEATDAAFAGPLARRAYAVRARDGTGTFVDLHLGEPTEASVLVLDQPARVVVDLRPGGGPLPPPAAIGDRVVVLEPRPGVATYPLTVAGYARTFEANVVVRLARGGEDVLEEFTTATAWTDAWGHYALTIPAGPAGDVRLHVGEYSARDGDWEGVTVPLHVR